MKTDSMKRIVAEWLEEKPLPNLIRREGPPLRLENLREILAVVGPRRAGKTWYMYQQMEDLIESGVCAKDDILFVDFEDYRLSGFTSGDVENLFVAFNQVAGKNPTYLFFDEVQRLPGWSRVLRTLHNKGTYRIVVSGSNSGLLAGEVSSELRGRYHDRLILPFSFAELLDLRGIDRTERSFLTGARGRILKEFDAYLKHGGFPEVLKREIAAERRELIQGYFRTIFYKDVIERHGIKAKYVLEAMMRYCLDVYADLFSISSFEKTLKQAGLPGSKRTISNYLQYLSEAFFLMTTENFSYSPRKRIMNPKKVYLLDLGFAFLSADFEGNYGKLLENAVAIELFRRKEDFFHFRGRRECDFLVKRGRAPAEAIQVTWDLTPGNSKREIGGLEEAMRNFKIGRGLILTYDLEEEIEHDGRKIEVRPVWKWLLSGR